jgi:aminobenzoyl-glutamate transport protein
MAKKTLTMRSLDLVERFGNLLPHPFWLFCGLVVGVTLLSAGLNAADVKVEKPETQLLNTMLDGERVGGKELTVDASFSGLEVDLGSAAHSSRLNDLHLRVYEGDNLVHDTAVARSQLADMVINRELVPELSAGHTYRAHIVNSAQMIEVKSLLSKEGLTWFVLHMVENFSHFEPLGLVLVMLMGVAIAEGSGLIPTAMRGIALAVPPVLIIPVLFALAACGNIGSDAGIVVIPPLAAAVFKQMGRNPIAGLLVGYVGATAGFTANVLPAGTDVLAMSLTNAATGGSPEVNVFCNWYFMTVSVVFLAAVGTWVTLRYTMPRLGDSGPKEDIVVEGLTALQKRALGIALAAIIACIGIWLLTIVPVNGLLRHADPNPDLVWRSPFFKGLIPILFSVFAVGGIAYGLAAKTLTKPDDIVAWMTDSMKRMGGYIVLILVIAQFIRMFQFANLDQLIAVVGADLLKAAGMEQMPIPFFIAFICIIAIANMFMGSASAKWAIFAPIFVPMFMSLGFHPAFTQLLYRLGDSITNCVSPLYPFFPILLGWIAEHDKDKAQVGTVLSYLIPYASYLLVGWILMLIGWYLLGLPVGPDSPIFL